MMTEKGKCLSDVIINSTLLSSCSSGTPILYAIPLQTTSATAQELCIGGLALGGAWGFREGENRPLGRWQCPTRGYESTPTLLTPSREGVIRPGLAIADPHSIHRKRVRTSPSSPLPYRAIPYSIVPHYPPISASRLSIDPMT